MTTYFTNNPIGSVDVKDLYDNAQNLDIAVNDVENEAWIDRLGVPRKSWWGMEQDFQQFLLDSGYVNIGDYGPGLEITARNQTFWRDGELYRAGASLELPYTTTGDWVAEEGLFVALGDSSLRQELGDSINLDNGANLIGRGAVSIETIESLTSLTAEQRKSGSRYLVKEYFEGEGVGGGEFYWDAGRSAENDGGSVIDGFVRILKSPLTSEDFGGNPLALADHFYGTGGRIEFARAGVIELTDTLKLPAGVVLHGFGGNDTFNDATKGTVFSVPEAGVPIGIQLGTDPVTPDVRNRGISVQQVRVQGQGPDTATIGISTYDSLTPAISTIFSEISRCVARMLGVGFRYRNNWSMDFRHNVSTGCGIGHLIDGTVGGTSTNFDGLLSYSCDIGFKFSVTGYNYSGMSSCGADGSRIALDWQSDSSRGFAVRNFGIENLNLNGTEEAIGVHINCNPIVGYLTIDGISFGAHTEADDRTKFIKYVSGASVVIKNMIVTTGVLGGARILELGASAGSLTLENSRISIGTYLTIPADLFDTRITYSDVLVNGLQFNRAVGLFDFLGEKSFSWSSAFAGEASKKIFSKRTLLTPSTAGALRNVRGEPAFDTSNVPNFETIEFVNAGTGDFVFVGHSTGNTGLIMPSDVTVGPNESIQFIKRPNGNLYLV